ncbi:MAG: alpha/beta hydrolase [Phycisphaeraceae bacterium]
MNAVYSVVLPCSLVVMLGSSCLAQGRLLPTEGNVKYGPHARHVLDFWRAESNQPTPVLIAIHGGGFVSGNKSVNAELLQRCLDAKISVVAITYRLSSEVIAPASFEDTARAIQFVRSKAEGWNLDPKRVAATGASAGAGMALWCAFRDDMADPKSEDPVLRQSTRLTCLYLTNAQSSYDPRFIRDLLGHKDTYEHPALARVFGADLTKLDELPKEKYDLFEYVSAINFVSHGDPPVLLHYDNPLDTPVTTRAIGIHHAKFGVALKERMDKLGIFCQVQTPKEVIGEGRRLSAIEFLKQQFGLPE